jgi:hypothetical protein
LALKRFAHEFSRSSVISLPDIAVNMVALKEEVGRMASMADCEEITGFMVERIQVICDALYNAPITTV